MGITIAALVLVIILLNILNKLNYNSSVLFEISSSLKIIKTTLNEIKEIQKSSEKVFNYFNDRNESREKKRLDGEEKRLDDLLAPIIRQVRAQEELIKEEDKKAEDKEGENEEN